VPRAARPVGAALGWRLRESRVLARNPWFTLHRDRLDVAGRGRVDYSYYEHPGGVLVVPVLEDGRVLLIRQYRYPVDAWCREVPAGGLHGCPDPLTVARRELAEECGAKARRLKKVARFYTSNSMARETLHVVLATGVRLHAAPRPEAGEFIEPLIVTAATALRWARSGRIEDGKSALALLMCEKELLKAPRNAQ
jgi:ADP-ribose pyrophosphatase